MAAIRTPTRRPHRQRDRDAMSNAELLAESPRDGAAWEELIERYGRLVWHTARASTLDTSSIADVYQTVWARLWEHRGRITNPEHLGTWLVTTTRRETWQLTRSMAGIRPVSDLGADRLDPSSGPEGIVLAAERRGEVRRALDRMDPGTRALLLAVSRDARPDYRRISTQLDRPVGSIGPTRRRGLEKLRRELAPG
jgi:RNA polymerase sigma factor (sigma-70 family)